MAPFLPIVSLSRSQNVRIGRSPNAAVVPDFGQFASTTPGKDAQTGAFNIPVYVDLGDPFHRRDLQHHTTLGAVIAVGGISQTVTSDLFWTATANPAATSTYPNLVISAATVKSRTFGSTLAVPGTTLTIPSNTGGGATRTDLVTVSPAGVYTYITGTPGAGAPATPANTLAAGTVAVTTANVATWTTLNIIS